MPNMDLIYCKYCEEVREPQPIPNSEFVHPACNPISGHLNLGFMFQKFAKDQLASDLHRNSHVMTAICRAQGCSTSDGIPSTGESW